MNDEASIQSWEESLAIGQQGVDHIVEFLHSEVVRSNWAHTELVHRIEEDKRYQVRGIDLLWVVQRENFLKCVTVEVKSDRNHHTGNFFFETVSVEERSKPGAFLITRAEWLFYYFVVSKELYCIPIRTAKPWFLTYETEFVQRKVRTVRTERGQPACDSTWTTLGRLVPIKRAIREIPGVRRFAQREGVWTDLSNAL